MTERFVMTAPSGLFEFSNAKCMCKVALDYDIHGNPQYILKIKPTDEMVQFRHDFKEGLKLVYDHGHDKYTPYKDIPHTEKCVDVYNKLGMKSDVPRLSKDVMTDEKYAKTVAAYFEKYGFLKPLKNTLFEEFDPAEIGIIFDRIRMLVALQAAVDETKTDYNKVFNLTFMLALSGVYPLVNLKQTVMYSDSFFHPLWEAFKGIRYKVDYSRVIKEIDIGEKFSTEEINEKLYNCPIEFETWHAINGGEIKITRKGSSGSISLEEALDCDDFDLTIIGGEKEYPEGYDDIIVIKDYFQGDDDYFLMRLSDYEDTMGECEGCTTDEDKNVYYTQKKIRHLFAFSEYKGRSEKLFYDFLFHFNYEVCKIVNIETDKDFPVTFKTDIDFNKCEKFDEKYKSILLELAGITIKNEIDYMTSEIRTDYNPVTKSQGWRIPDLQTAIYYSISLTDRKQKVFRTCADPYCMDIFEILVTNDRGKYCSTKCQRAAAQRFVRASGK